MGGDFALIAHRSKLDVPVTHPPPSTSGRPEVANMAEQWRITWYEEGEEPLVEIVSSFADAWVLAQPYPEDDNLPWKWVERHIAVQRFAAGERAVRAAWVDNATQTFVERL